MSWEKIENHLFDKYCVEGEDRELGQLMKEHDEEIRQSTIQEFIERISTACKIYAIGNDAKNGHIVYAHSDGTWHNLMEDIAKQMIKSDKEKDSVSIPDPIYECYGTLDGKYNLRTVFYHKYHIYEFNNTVGQKFLSSSSFKDMLHKLEENGKCSYIWDLKFSDLDLIPKKYCLLTFKECHAEEEKKALENISKVRECMQKYINFTPCMYPWKELGVNANEELTYLHLDGSGDKLRGVIGSDGFPDILNDRNESVFDYMKEMDMTQEDIDYIRGIIDKTDMDVDR